MEGWGRESHDFRLTGRRRYGGPILRVGPFLAPWVEPWCRSTDPQLQLLLLNTRSFCNKASDIQDLIIDERVNLTCLNELG